jgi:hypothetical protein
LSNSGCRNDFFQVSPLQSRYIPWNRIARLIAAVRLLKYGHGSIRNDGRQAMGAGTLTFLSLLWTAGALPPDVAALNQRAIQIPIEFNPSRRREIRELLLFVSEDQGRNWTQEAVAKPTDEAFNFSAKRDGVYWFSVCIIDLNGRREPVDINAAPPGLKVLIDTQPPVLRMRTADRVGDEITVMWEIQDAYPDAGTLKLSWRPSGDAAGQWTEVPVSPAATGQKAFRVGVSGPVTVRMTVDDYARNKAHAQQEVAAGSTRPVASRNPEMGGPGSMPGTIVPPGSVTPPPYGRDIQPATSFDHSPDRARGYPVATAPGTSDTYPVASNVAAPPPARPELKSNAQLINSTEISLAYEMSKVGPSGLRSAKLYMTHDDGQTWQEIAEDRNRQQRISAKLPGEGIFGFRLVLESGAGLSKGPPLAGDQPEMRVEVDLTPPQVELAELAPDPSNPSAVILRWSAQDKNMAPNPVVIEWAESQEGPWKPVANSAFATTGTYSWKMPPQMPVRVFLRIRARDLAGNMGEARTLKPQLVDVARPEGRLTGIVSTKVQDTLIDPR